MKKSAGEGQTRVTGLWLLLAALPLSSGAALVVYVLTSISLGLALLGAGVIVVATGFFCLDAPDLVRTNCTIVAYQGWTGGRFSCDHCL